MTPRQINSAMKTGAAAQGVAAVACLALSSLLPLNAGRSAAEQSAAHASAAAVKLPASLPPLESFKSIVSAPLRKSLLDDGQPAQAPVAAPAAPAASPQQAQIKLVGTIGDSLAMLRCADGTVAVRGVGAEVDGAVVVAIRPSQVDLRIAGKDVTIEKEKNPTAEPQFIHSGQ